MATTANRIPLQVNHNSYDNSGGYRAHASSSSSQHHHQSSSSKLNEDMYDMRNMYDETDRIKNRMREFEDRCKRWREEFFARSNNHQFSTPSTLLSDVNDQRVPFTYQESFFPSGTTYASPSHTAAAPPASTATPSPPFASSMHRSFIEDLNDGSGGKKYKIEFEIGDFKQNELLITTNGRSLVIKGDRELKAGSSTETKTFNRELTLPDYVDLNKMTAYLIDNEIKPNSSTTTTTTTTTSNGQQITVSKSSQPIVNNLLYVEAPIIMEKYSYRRSAFDTNNNYTKQSKSQSPVRQTTVIKQASPTRAAGGVSSSESHHSENKSSTTSTTHTTTSRVVHGSSSGDDYAYTNTVRSSVGAPTKFNEDDHIYLNKQQQQQHHQSPVYKSTGNLSPSQNAYNNNYHLSSSSNQSIAPELIPGYPVYDSAEACVVYKFDLSGFDQSEIHLTITVDRTLEIKACKESSDHLGKVYREFKREIQLEPEVDANLIKNLLHEGILTLKIPKASRPDGVGSVSNNHNLHAPNGFREIYNDDGKLAKLTTDFRGYNPENVKIVLSSNNVLKVNAQQVETSPNSKGTVQKECTRQYTLPDWIQPEHMKAIMSRDGILTVDFTGNSNLKSSASSASNRIDERVHIN